MSEDLPRGEDPADICPRPERLPAALPEPLAPPIYLSSVYRCADPDEADQILGGERAGFVYRRDRHPNADQLAEKCQALHGAELAVICGSGMSALAAMALAHLRPGDHLLVSRQLYGKTQQLLVGQLGRWGVTSELVDVTDLGAVARALDRRPRMLVVETISNPTLRLADVAGLSRLCRQSGTHLVVDNTFAGPVVCRPLELGADLVMESLTKIMNGHSDVILGLVCGSRALVEPLGTITSTWGLSAAPLDCWLTLRGIVTLALRTERASANALAAAQHLAAHPAVTAVHYPGLERHADHDLARRQFFGLGGAMVSFEVAGGWQGATRFIRGARQIPFCPSLGESSTTLSHPASTSHRGHTPPERAALGIGDGLIRLSVGIESSAAICRMLDEGLGACGGREE